MHFADGGIVRLVNICGADIAMEIELWASPSTPSGRSGIQLVTGSSLHKDLADETDEVIARKILPQRRRAVESAKETILEVVGRPLDDQLKHRVRCSATRSAATIPRSASGPRAFLEQRDADRVTTRGSSS